MGAVAQRRVTATGRSRDDAKAHRPRGEAEVIERLMPYLLVGVGSFVGGNARFVLGRWVGGMIDTRFPLGTFLINVSGSFLLGLIGGLLADRALPHADLIRLALGTGFCGGFTTFSTFEYETHALFEDGVWLSAVTNMFASLFVGLLAVRFGVVAARSWF
jgi:CrcB protein